MFQFLDEGLDQNKDLDQNKNPDQEIDLDQNKDQDLYFTLACVLLIRFTVHRSTIKTGETNQVPPVS